MKQIAIIILLVILVVIGILNFFNNKQENIYFFLNKGDDKSLELLNNILENSNSKVILVNYDKDIDLIKLNKIINNCNKIRPIHNLINIENMEELEELYKNRKCVNQPGDKFYEIVNKVGVFGYPFNFQNNPSELLNNDNKIHKANTNSNRIREYVDVPTCGRRRSGCN
jgi:hypothetical protein